MATHSRILSWIIRGTGGWWAAIYGVAQSQTRPTWLSRKEYLYIFARQRGIVFLWIVHPSRGISVQFTCSVVSDSVTPWITACQDSLSITKSRSLPKLMSIESVMPSSHLILCCPCPSLLQSFPASSLFKWVSCSHQVAKVLECQLHHQSFQWIFGTAFL